MALYEELIKDNITGETTIRPYTPEEILGIKETLPLSVRMDRDFFLQTEVDPIAGNALRWAALTSEQQQAWADYRQALLDLPAQSGFPSAENGFENTVVWPTKPE
jgi:hypothetical protein